MDQIELIDRLGGNSVLAHKLGIGQSAVSNWRKDGSIPAARHFQVFVMAKKEGIELSDDFFLRTPSAPDPQPEGE